MPKISVVIPVYNNEKYIKYCINSILEQTFEDFELLLIDDGSTDDSGAICDQYAKKDARTKVIHQENAGVSSARNRGIKEAQGTYLMFCDSDDWVHPNWCEELYSCIVEYTNAFVVCDVQKVNLDGESVARTYLENVETNNKQTYFDVWKMGLSGYSVNKIYDRKKIIMNSIFFPQDISYAEDVVFNINYYKTCTDVILLSKQLYYYRDNPTSLMHKRYDDFFPIYALPFRVRFPIIPEDKLGEYCDVWLYYFIQMLGYIHERKNITLIKKLKYNQGIFNSEEFRMCLKYATGRKESAIFLKILHMHNYYLFWIFEKVVKVKRKLIGTLRR